MIRVLVIPAGDTADSLSDIERVTNTNIKRRLTWRELAAENNIERIEPLRDGLVARFAERGDRAGIGIMSIPEEDLEK